MGDGCFTRAEKLTLEQVVPAHCEDDPDLLYSICTTVSVIRKNHVTREQKLVREVGSYAFCRPCAKERAPDLFP